jgi:hypothetical protein
MKSDNSPVSVAKRHRKRPRPVRRPGGLHRAHLRGAAAGCRHAAQRPIHPLRRGSTRAPHREDADLRGDAVNLPSRIESSGVPGTIQMTGPVYEQLADKFVFEPRGAIDVKGKGRVEGWLLKLL